MDLEGVLSSPVVLVLATGLVGVASAWVAAYWQRSHGRELERDRFRHDMASRAAEVRLTVYTNLAAHVAGTYRAKCSSDPKTQDLLNATKNYFFDNRFFFSAELGRAFRAVSKSLAVHPYDKQVLEDNLNAFFNTVRDDLLLSDLSQSVTRAVGEAKRPDSPSS